MAWILGSIFFVLTVGPAWLITYLASIKFLKGKPPREKWLWLVPVFLISAGMMFAGLVLAAALVFQR